MIGKPTFVNCINDIGYPCFAEISDKTTFALAPINVPLPPRHAPNETAHHNGVTSTCPCMAKIIGSIVATKGMLSKNDEITADPTSNTSIRTKTFWFVAFTRACASISITPVCLSAPTITNNPKKKSNVVHSMSCKAFSTFVPDSKSVIPAPAIAI